MRLFGYAGTGKTTLARHVAEDVDGEVKFAAFTGKAALVMRAKGCDDATTIHSLIYRAREGEDEQPSFELWDGAPASKAKLIVIDECSMVDAELGRDLLSFGVPLSGAGRSGAAAADRRRRLLHRASARRHADRGAPPGEGRSDRAPVDAGPRRRPSRAGRLRRSRRWCGATVSIRRACSTPTRCWSAATPRGAPTMRACASGAALTEPLPVAGDKLVCLRNNRKKGLFNGGLWNVKDAGGARARARHHAHRPRRGCRLRGGKVRKVTVRPECFTGGIEASRLAAAQAI